VRAGARTTSRSTLRLTALDRASTQNAWMISASRCSMVIRWGVVRDQRLGGDLGVVGDDDGGLIAA
jgi:hypothetical protein